MKRSPIRKISKKKQKELKGKVVYSTFKPKRIKNDKELDQALCERAGREWIARKCIGASCETCKKYSAILPLTRSHIIAKSRGGKNTINNIILECIFCHNKYEKKPETRPKDSIGYKLYLEQIKDIVK